MSALGRIRLLRRTRLEVLGASLSGALAAIGAVALVVRLDPSLGVSAVGILTFLGLLLAAFFMAARAPMYALKELEVSELERRRAEQDQKRLLQQMGRLAKVGGWEFDVATGKGQWTEEVGRIHDLDPSTEPSKELGLQFYPVEARDRIGRAVATAIEQGIPYDLELPFVSARGVHKWVRTIGEPVLEEGRVVRMRGAFVDVTARKEAESLIALQHGATRILAESSTVPDAVARLLELVCETLGWEVGEFWSIDAAQQTLRCTQTHTHEDARFSQFVAGSRELTFSRGQGLPGRVWDEARPVRMIDPASDETFTRKHLVEQAGLRDAVAFPISSQHRIVGVVDFFSTQGHRADLPTLAALATIGTQVGHFLERRQLEDQFRQAQKLEAIGTLAGGIAHDFNNILMAILGNASVARSEAEGTELKETLDDVIAAARRASELVKQILAFSRRQEAQRQPVQLCHVVSEATKLLRATIPTSIAFRSELESDAPSVLADVTQVHQVVMNLVTNAAHAMHDGGGQLEFRLEPYDVGAEFAELHPGLRPGPYARLSIRDTGAGMDAPTLERIFEPFFTTKPQGEGTGLGLSVVHGIMQAHEGTVTVSSQPGKGTRFDLYFPAAGMVSPSVRPGPSVAVSPRAQGEWVLVIDDDPMVCQTSKRALERFGFAVATSLGAVEGCELFEADPSRFQLVITDLTMPGMDGLGVARRVTSQRPTLPVILMTGFLGALTPEEAATAGIRAILHKPVSVEQLGQMVIDVLAAGGGSSFPPSSPS